MEYWVSVDTPISRAPYLYLSDEIYRPGAIVKIPFGKQKELGGVVLGKKTEPSEQGENSLKLKSIIGIHEEFFQITENEFQLFDSIAKYYCYPVGKFIFDCLPSILETKKKNNKVEVPKSYVCRSNAPLLPLNNVQQALLSSMLEKLKLGHQKFLLHGITGSGKSIIYVELMKQVLRTEKKSVLFLLPEINLTSQFLDFFSSLLGSDIPVFTYHSKVTPKQKFILWKHLQKDHAPCVVLAARSGIFLPQSTTSPFGLVILDEEHDSSYKQDDRCHFHTRTVALKRCELEKSTLVLGSATPSLESLYLFDRPELKENVYRMQTKYAPTTPPELKMVTPVLRKDPLWPLGEVVFSSINETLSAGGQVLVFANKLGHAHSLYCSHCKHAFECSACSIKLTYFKNKNILKCHGCEFVMSAPRLCPSCGSLDIYHHGFGTEKIHELLKENLPKENILRFDREALSTPTKVEGALNDFHSQKSRIMVGTQMLAKGHNFPNVQLIVILGVDHLLHFPHFRAQERVWQLLKQVIGRGGRRGQASKVLVVSNEIGPIIDQLPDEFDEQFLKMEMMLRKSLKFPPSSLSAQIAIYDKDSSAAADQMLMVKKILEELKSQKKIQLDFRGPRPTFVEKSQNYFGQVMELFSPMENNGGEMQKVITYLQNKISLKGGARFYVDIDPEHPL
ncbi:MAG: primosomal protein N' [Bacteriovoracaceae bacterium]|nr:primosomal protein N' [Bacteriovoracaceae bacterium]